MRANRAVKRTGNEAQPVALVDAIAAASALLSPVFETGTVRVASAHRRVLARDLIAPVALPLRDSSAVDGYAVQAHDVKQLPVALDVIGEAAAGHPFPGVAKPGSAVRIFTGGAVPEGCDRVVMQENCTERPGQVMINAAGKVNIRLRGEDVRQGQLVLKAGRRLRVEDIAILHALGLRDICVRRQLKVGLFSTGDEVREPGDLLAPGQLWDANRSLLAGLLRASGCEVTEYGIVGDDTGKLEEALCAAAADCNLLVTTGGMSVGAGDCMRRIIARRGCLELWPLAIKPGKPVGFGDIDDCPILALPGNPVAAALTYIAFGRPLVDRLGCASPGPDETLLLPAGFAFAKQRGIRQFLLATAKVEEGASRVVPVDVQGPAMLSALIRAGGIAILDEDRLTVAPGDIIPFMPLHSLLG